MAAPAHRPLSHEDKAEILAAIVALTELVERRFDRFDERLRKVEGDGAELKGRVAGIEGALRHVPTIWQIAALNVGLVALVAGVFGGALALLRALGP